MRCANPFQLTFDFLDGLRHGHARAPTRPPAPAPARAYELLRHPRRRNLAIEVHADLRVVVRAPARYPAAEIEHFVAERAAWIETQLAHFRRRGPLLAPRLRYVDGEAHPYLGQHYPLALRPAAPDGVVFEDACLRIGGAATRTASDVRRALDAWYRTRAAIEFTTLLDHWHAHPRFARYPRPALNIRAMRTRWGSLGSRRGMTLNLALIQAPRSCIEYVVVHELCHLRFHGHGRGFYDLLAAVMPDWRARKTLLEASVR